jgi:hypothetical protein
MALVAVSNHSNKVSRYGSGLRKWAKKIHFYLALTFFYLPASSCLDLKGLIQDSCYHAHTALIAPYDHIITGRKYSR